MKPTPLTDKFIEDFCDKIDITLFKKGKNLFDFIIEYQLFIEDSLYFFRKLRDEIHNAIQPSDGTFYVKYFREKFKRCWKLLAYYHEWTEKHFVNYMQMISPGIDDSQAQRYKKEYQYCLDRSNEFFYYLSEYFEELKETIGYTDPIVEETPTDILKNVEGFWNFLIDYLENGESDFRVFMNQWLVNPITENHPGTLQFRFKKKPIQAELVRKTEEFWDNDDLKRIIESKSHLIYHIVSSFHQRFERYNPKDAFDLDSNLYKLFRDRPKKSRT